APCLPVLQFETHHRAQSVADAIADVVGDLLVTGGANVAGGASGSGGVVLANYPGLRIQVHFGDIRAELDAVLGLGVDLGLGMIRPQMTLAAVFGLAGQGGAERMPSVTG